MVDLGSLERSVVRVVVLSSSLFEALLLINENRQVLQLSKQGPKIRSRITIMRGSRKGISRQEGYCLRRKKASLMEENRSWSQLP
jgi:ribosomal protein L19